MARLLIIAGALLIAVGWAWPFVARLGLGRPPGDIVIQRGSTGFYFPVVTCVVISIVLSLLFWLLRK